MDAPSATCEAAMKSNPLVQFLASYGPQPSSNNLYDEFVLEASAKTGCAAIQIEQPLVAELVAMLGSAVPKTVILTGTAGDGKTYTARKIAQALSGQERVWVNTQKYYDLPTIGASGRSVRFIKDLSELNEDEKNRIFPEVEASLTGKSATIFVVCVNDGHLLKFFRDRRASALHDRIAEMLRTDESEDRDGHFRLINMSRQSHRNLVDQIVDGVVEHPGWAGCDGCPALTDQQKPCPIRRNRAILERKDAASMRARLKDMVRMAAADGRHLSIRQLILLTVNVLLGDRKPGSTLLTCQKARNRASENDYASTNPYANAFGANLTERERRQYGAFIVMNEFQVGYETNNTFDHGLLWGDETFPTCPYYGETVFDPVRKAYQDDAQRASAEFHRGMVDQRRRLFFSIDPQSPEVKADPRRSPWNLSVFKHGAEYVAIVESLMTSGSPGSIGRTLVRGLNRMMTGEMTITDDRLWVTAPSGVYMGREIPLLVQQAGSRKFGGLTTLTFSMPSKRDKERDDNGRPPFMRVVTKERLEHAVDLHLRPTLVECLLRIADGALPASFSAESQREVERFQLQVVAATRQALGTPPVPKEVQMSGGVLQEHTIAVMAPGDEW
jgi:hypothetical protein